MKLKITKHLEPNPENFIEVYIRGKNISYTQIPSGSDFGFQDNNIFKYKNSNEFKYHSYKFKPNSKIIVQALDPDDDSILIGGWHSRISYKNRLILGWTFGNLWIQKSEYIKWFIALVVPIILFFVGLYVG
jgi:hypothetical protein